MPPPNITIVGEKAWRPEVTAALRRLDPWQRRLAETTLRYMHDLHIGLTPQLAAGLARTLTGDPGGLQGQGLWSRVYDTLAQQFAGPDGADSPPHDSTHAAASLTDPTPTHPGKPRRRYAGMVPGAAPAYYLLRIAVPLVARACDDLGSTYLFSADWEPCPASFLQDYARYSANLENCLRALLENGHLSPVFWTDRAFTLSHLSRTEGAAKGLPEVDPVGLAQLLRLDPQVHGQAGAHRPLPRRLTQSPRSRPLQHGNQGGIDGLHQTRRLADLPSILKSELLQPLPLLLDRVLQSGYLALRRPPLKEKRRDVLMAGLLPPQPHLSKGAGAAQDSVLRGLVKAAWFDAMARLSVWLQQAGLLRSELLWIEADPWGRRQESRSVLERLAASGLGVPREATPAYRRELLAALGWLPGYLDLNRHGRRPGRSGKSRQVEAAKDPVRWAADAWQRQLDDPHWRYQDSLEDPADRPQGRKGETPLAADAYSTVHVMLFLPRSLHQSSRASLGALRHGLGLGAERGSSLTVTWLPATVDDLDRETGWAVTAPRTPTRPLALASPKARPPAQDPSGVSPHPAGSPHRPQEAPAALENRLAGALLDLWLRAILKELCREP